ncbi:MAG: type II toxin-antitoxin system HicA family toxin [Bdellovibrionales bacterium]|nr:type II toxin-antitoxin system HicA family toxin [Bdellovibrionales bacterium]
MLRQGGSHEIWTNGKDKVAVPRHREINEMTAKAILRQAKMESK